jgi:hypothetical protein
MSKSTTTTIVPAASTRAVTPKPTKSEVIEALTRLKIEEIGAENAKREAAIDAQRAAIKNLVLGGSSHLGKVLVENLSTDHVNITTGCGESHVEITLRISTNPSASSTWDNPMLIAANSALKQALDALKKLPSPQALWSHSRKEIQKQIRDSLTRDAAGRVTRLLEDVESRAALSDLLKVVESGAEKRLN